MHFSVDCVKWGSKKSSSHEKYEFKRGFYDHRQAIHVGSFLLDSYHI